MHEQVQVVECVDHTCKFEVKVNTTPDHAMSRHLSPIRDRGGGMGARETDFSSSQHDQELLWGAVVGASGPGASPCPCVVSAHAHDGALRGALSW